ncbi:hypothetical protein CgunFtcFv8_003471 [Champsocephalus gunnari]|uniref:Uncharacterized protein n=1 Tax=Champsocephalus gunnari TaxID=52237 RepID=A0AAN8DAX8_CHAGU|nr:hypothetical protein CgunFtcFv8_003471 [Champsocephalus gunnari]
MSIDLPAGNQDAGASAAECEPLTITVWGSSTAAAAEPDSRAISGRDPVAARDAETGPHAIPSWGSRLDLTMVSPAEDVLELDYMEDEEDASEFLLSDSDEQEDNIFGSSAQAAKPGAMAALPGDSTPASPCLSMDLQAACQRTASRLDIPWPEMAKETSRSRYEGKHFPQTTRTKRQLLPVFPEMLDEGGPLATRPQSRVPPPLTVTVWRGSACSAYRLWNRWWKPTSYRGWARHQAGTPHCQRRRTDSSRP